MRQTFMHSGGRGRHFAPDDLRGHPPHPHGPNGRPGGPRRRGRPFDYGDLRLIVLAMIAEEPRHGYELMRAIEARMGGGYSPSPGVIYPTLSWLEDMGFAASEPEGGRRSYRLTTEGEAFLAANREPLARLTERMGGSGRHRDRPDAVMAAMGVLKQALRARFASGSVDDAAAEDIAAAIRAAAAHVEGTMNDTTSTASLSSTADVLTPKAAGYAAQLCKHFAHKVPARFEDGSGEIEFAAGTCRLVAGDDRLSLTARAGTPEALAQVEDVVARHLVRFAFREDLAIEWQRS